MESDWEENFPVFTRFMDTKLILINWRRLLENTKIGYTIYQVDLVSKINLKLVKIQELVITNVLYIEFLEHVD